MDIISQQACEKCSSVEKCVFTAMYHPGHQMRCVHFGYVARKVNELTNTTTNEFAKYVDYLLWKQE